MAQLVRSGAPAAAASRTSGAGGRNLPQAVPLACTSSSTMRPAPVANALRPLQQQGAPATRQIVACSAARPTAVPPVYQEQGGGDPILAELQKHEDNAPRPAAADEARTWVQLARTGFLATIDGDSGFPATSIVEFAADPKTGFPVFSVSTRSLHTPDLAGSGRVSLTVAAPRFASLNDGRVMLQGTVRPVRDDEKAALREVFLAKYPDAFYVDFGDFRWFILDNIRSVRFNGGFGRAGKMSPEEYLAGKPDPVAAFSAPVCGHMNADHQADNLALIKHFTPLKDVEQVTLLDLDRLGINTEVSRKGSRFKVRLPFAQPVENRKAIKDAIVDMTKAAKAAAAAQAAQ